MYTRTRVLAAMCLPLPLKPTLPRPPPPGATAIPGVSALAPGEKLVEVMRVKRAAHTSTISATKRQRELDAEERAADVGGAEAGAVLATAPASKRLSLVPETEAAGGRYREEGFYVSHVPGEGEREESFYAAAEAGQFNDAVLDLTAEDAGEGEGLQVAGEGGKQAGTAPPGAWGGGGGVRGRRLPPNPKSP